MVTWEKDTITAKFALIKKILPMIHLVQQKGDHPTTAWMHMHAYLHGHACTHNYTPT